MLNILLSIKPFVLLPIIIFIIAVGFGASIKESVKSSLYIGVGMVGITILFDFFIQIVKPVVDILNFIADKQSNILDVGWPALAMLVWSTKIAVISVPLVVVVNLILVLLKFTKTINVDIWNFWHMILVGAIVYEGTQNIFLALIAVVVTSIIVLKLADWNAGVIKDYFGLNNISSTTITSIVYMPVAFLVDDILSKIPVFDKINLSGGKLKERLSFFVNPAWVAFVVAVVISAFAGYAVNDILNFSVQFTAVFLILPKIVAFINEGFIPVSNAINNLI